ncbi:MAG: hypothetical protein N2035_08880 [Chthoniobacterales bacterium]|nr:hypothetical protein [Chthoniobacterales bacterium]
MRVARVRDVIHHAVAPDVSANMSLAIRKKEAEGFGEDWFCSDGMVGLGA